MATAAASRKRRHYAPRVPAEERREQLLNAALHLVVTEGHSATTMESVAVQAGVAKPVVYGMFANRAELLAALLRREQDQALAQLLAILPGSLGGRADPGALLAEILDGFLSAVRAAPERWHCIVMPMPDMPLEFHAAREQARGLALDRAEDLARWLLRTIGAPPGLDPEIVAHTMVTLSEMAARLVLSDPEHFRPERFVAGISAAVGLTLPSPGTRRPKQ